MLADAEGKVLARRVVHFRNVWTQEWGLRFRKPALGTAYVFDFGRDVRMRFSMWFVFSPIDVYFLDARMRVVDAKRRFRPFTSYRPDVPFRYAIETRPGLFPARLRGPLRFSTLG